MHTYTYLHANSNGGNYKVRKSTKFLRIEPASEPLLRNKGDHCGGVWNGIQVGPHVRTHRAFCLDMSTLV